MDSMLRRPDSIFVTSKTSFTSESTLCPALWMLLVYSFILSSCRSFCTMEFMPRIPLMDERISRLMLVRNEVFELLTRTIFMNFANAAIANKTNMMYDKSAMPALRKMVKCKSFQRLCSSTRRTTYHSPCMSVENTR